MAPSRLVLAGTTEEPDCILRRMKRVLFVGSVGQGGSCLAKFLLSKGCGVQGLIQRSSSFSTGRIDHQYRGSWFSEARCELGWRAKTRIDILRTTIDCYANNRRPV